jgi:hypothetical protein
MQISQILLINFCNLSLYTSECVYEYALCVSLSIASEFSLLLFLAWLFSLYRLQLATSIDLIGWLSLPWIASLDESQPFTLLQLTVMMHLCLFSNHFRL